MSKIRFSYKQFDKLDNRYDLGQNIYEDSKANLWELVETEADNQVVILVRRKAEDFTEV